MSGPKNQEYNESEYIGEYKKIPLKTITIYNALSVIDFPITDKLFIGSTRTIFLLSYFAACWFFHY